VRRGSGEADGGWRFSACVVEQRRGAGAKEKGTDKKRWRGRGRLVSSRA
jgi:hypothetical protein